MIPSISSAQTPIFLSLFKGRDDVFAIRWEKEGKSGYTPAYDLNWEEFSRYKTSGGTLKDFPNKQFSRLTEQRIINHLTGKEVIGFYPLLADNSSWFVVADFDENPTSKKSWIEECHHVPAKTFREVIKSFTSYYLYGLTATPVRKNNDEKLIFIHIGDVIHEIKRLAENNTTVKKVAVIVRETELIIPFDYKTDKTETLYQILIHDSERNRLIIEDIKTEANTGKKILVLTERKAHVEVLYQYLKNKFDVITISGDDSTTSKKIKYKQINEGIFF